MLNRLSLSLVLVLCAGVLSTACGNSVEGGAAPRIVVVPGTLLFERPTVGGDLQELLIQNNGQDDLTITGANIGAPMFEIVSGFEGSLTIEPNGSAAIVVSYTPTESGNDGGTLVLAHNDFSASGETRVPLVVSASAARLFVNPNPINFGRVEALDHREITANLTNIGGAALTVSNYLIVGGNGMFSFADGEAFTQSFTLGPDQARPIRINYDPVDDALHRAQLVVESNDPNTENGRTLVDIVGNGAEPCIEIVPNNDGTYDFRERTLDRTTEETFTVRNCSDADAGQPLEVTSIVLADDSSAAYALAQLPEFPLVLQPQETSAFLVQFTPTVDLQVEEATLVATSNDPYTPTLEIDLTGIGTTNECPIARPVCTVIGSGEPAVTDLFTIPLANLQCNGTASEDLDGEVTDYIWSVAERPDGSSAQFDPANTETTEFFVDLTGRFVLQLEVVDDRGCVSEPAEVSVVARPDEDIHVQVVWTTPGDPDPNDIGAATGTDIDVHFLHPNGCWGDIPWDIYYRNKEADWGTPGSATDDPSLDRDDTDGWGPENVNLNRPEAGATYKIAVHYYNDWGYGPSYVTARIYIYGVLVFEARDKLMERSDQWWVVGALHWPSGEVTAIDTMYELNAGEFPPCN
jgi:hypothetical protein